MDLRHLRTFVAVAEEGSFTRAGQRLHLAQPAVSVQVRQLEEELGVVLIDRSRRAIELTEAGALMLSEARAVLRRLDRALADVRRLGDEQARQLSVGFLPSLAAGGLLPALRRFEARHPQLSLELHDLLKRDLIGALHDGTVDVALLYGTVADETLRSRVLAREPLAVALPAGHPAAARERVELAALAGEPFVLPVADAMPALHDRVLEICAAAGFTPRAARADSRVIQTMLALVASGAGIALLPRGVLAARPAGVVAAEIVCPADHHVDVRAVWLGDRRPPATTALLDALAGTGAEHGAACRAVA